jgi:hypothetical protein
MKALLLSFLLTGFVSTAALANPIQGGPSVLVLACQMAGEVQIESIIKVNLNATKTSGLSGRAFLS